MDNMQLVLFLLTFLICFDLVELFVVHKRFRKCSEEFNLMYYAIDGIVLENELSEKNRQVEGIDEHIKSIKIKFLMKMVSKVLIDVCLAEAIIYVIIFDIIVTFLAFILCCLKPIRM